MSANEPTFDQLIHFVAKGRTNMVFVQDNQRILGFDFKKRKLFEVADFGSRAPINHIERYSAFLLVQTAHQIDFVQFENKQVVNSVQKIKLSEEIKHVQVDLLQLRFVFVQTSEQVYLFDCDYLLQVQYSPMTPIEQS